MKRRLAAVLLALVTVLADCGKKAPLPKAEGEIRMAAASGAASGRMLDGKSAAKPGKTTDFTGEFIKPVPDTMLDGTALGDAFY